jgi:hypothetical protein
MAVTPTAASQICEHGDCPQATETDFDMTNNSASLTMQIVAAASSPVMLDDNLMVSTVVSGLSAPISMAFIGVNDFLYSKLDQARSNVLSTEQFNPLYLTACERLLLNADCSGLPYIQQFSRRTALFTCIWTESSSGVDSFEYRRRAALSNRVDRYIWNGTTLTFDRTL